MKKGRLYKIRNYDSNQFNELYKKAVEEFTGAKLKGAIITIYYLPFLKKGKPRLQLEFNTIPDVVEEMGNTQELLSHISFMEYCDPDKHIDGHVLRGWNFMTLFDLVKNDSVSGIDGRFYYQSALTSDDFYNNIGDKDEWLVEVIERTRNGEILAEIFIEEEKRLAANKAADKLLRLK